VDARIRPIRRPVHMAVFHRIEMDVIHMSRKIHVTIQFCIVVF
jgi:hypothetical protein